MDDKMPLRIRYEYEQGKDSTTKYAHGVWGGINPMGEIELNFYLESDKLPGYTESLIEEAGHPGPELIPDEGGVKTVVRHIHSRVLVNYHTARALLDWLEEKIEAIETDGESLRPYFDSGMEQ